MKAILDWLRRFFKRKRSLSPTEIEKALPAKALAALKAEAAFLKDVHGVEVRALAGDEKATQPRAVDETVEARFTAPGS